MNTVKISIVTPSYQQGAFLETCIRSVVEQTYPELEYFVMDGGSTDGSLDIIKKYQGRLSGWESKKDGGQYKAIENGFARSSGEIMGWLNSDDAYLPWTFQTVANIFEKFPDVDWISSRFHLVMNAAGEIVHCRQYGGFHPDAYYRGQNMPRQLNFYTHFISQESTFWRRGLWEKSGAYMDQNFKYAGDFELWARFFQHAELVTVPTPLAAFRKQPNQVSDRLAKEYMEECIAALAPYQRLTPGWGEAYLRRIFRRLPMSILQRLPTSIVYPYSVLELIDKPGRALEWQKTTRWMI